MSSSMSGLRTKLGNAVVMSLQQMELYHGYFGFSGFEIISLYEIQILLTVL